MQSSLPIEISIVSPVYRAEKIIDELVRQIIFNVEQVTPNFEIILVEDASPDNSWNKIEHNCNSDKRVKGVKLNKNYGQHNAIAAGLYASTGNYVVVMDCDLQDNPKYISSLYSKAKEGYEIVYTLKDERNHDVLKNLTANLYFVLYNYVAGYKAYNQLVGAYSMLSKSCVDQFIKIKNDNHHFLQVLYLTKKKSSHIYVHHDARFEGTSSYTYTKLLKHAFKGLASQYERIRKLFIRTFILSLIVATFFLYLFFRYNNSIWYLLPVFILAITIVFSAYMVIYMNRLIQNKVKSLFEISQKINFQ
jgi:glycosyltransferase involved in cell wall biosynthesis